ncbi:hypothetical protein K9N68_29925 [Kovacikia minuta CCNUW1]|uniref:hypothetical protein n=1 Tax=Kovacikia minuta TaxID=2931930 RepID=UPI001CCD2655|nr:hypothetical protein [Kovacikia minuta]UBF25724.1 hypothetical protein K9N68_29925 [Kovacikia minuta CCNUW1]
MRQHIGMGKFSIWIIKIWLILNLIPIALAQTVPQPDPNGDYFSNEAPLKRKNPPPKMQAGSLWRVVSFSLNCRATPGVSQPVVRQYKQGSILEADVGRGGSDEVLMNAKDANGKPWMAVRGQSVENRCYVRANSKYIHPLSLAK